MSENKISNRFVDGRLGGTFRAPGGIEVIHAFDRGDQLVVTFLQPNPEPDHDREYRVIVASGGDVLDTDNMKLVATLIRREQAFQIFVKRNDL